MNRMKTIAAAVALAAAGNANAVIILPNSGDGELVLTAWDDVAQVSYIRQLNVNLSSFLPSSVATDAGYSQTFAADTTFSSLFAGSSAANIRWNVTAFDQAGANYNDMSYITTAALGAAASSLPGSNTGINSAGNAATIFFGFANSNGCDVNDVCTSTNSGDLHYAGSTFYWSDNIGNTIGFSNAGTLGEALGFYHVTPSGAAAFLQATKTAYATSSGLATWTLDADGSLTYSAPAVSTVPVPAAAWLLSSGLIGMAGVARRRAAK